MNSRWDFLYGLKPVPLEEHLLEEIAKLVAQELGRWPVAIEEWATPEHEARFARLLRPDSPRPEPAVYAAAFRLARLELMREFEQIDDFMRNERWREVAAPGDGLDSLLLLSRYLTEMALGVLEATQGRLKRPQLVDCLLRAERKLRSPVLVPAGQLGS